LPGGKGFLLFLPARVGSLSSFRLPHALSAHVFIRPISKKHLTNLIFNCKNEHYRPVYK
jgi:hypothetical protein